MALHVTNIERKFSYKKDSKTIDLPDPNINMSPEEVMKFHSTNYPELNNAMIEGPVVVANKAIYTVKTKAGQLG